MKEKTAEAMVRRINKREGEVVASVYRNYSGRGMFGRITTGVVLPMRHVPKGRRYRMDNVGLDVIIY